MVTKLKISNYDNSKTQTVTALKNFNSDKTPIVTELKGSAYLAELCANTEAIHTCTKFFKINSFRYLAF